MSREECTRTRLLSRGCRPAERALVRLASRLLSAWVPLATAVVASGCINPIWELEPRDPAVNYPPVLLPERTFPVASVDPVEANIGANCAAVKFRVTPVDFDGNVLSFKWLLIGRLGQQDEGRVLTRRLTGGSLNPSEAPLDEVLPGASEEYPNGAWYPTLELEFDRTALGGGFDNPSSLAGDGKTHLLSVFVTDQTFGQDPINTVPLTGDGPAQPAAAASWQISILETDCPASQGGGT